MESTVCTRITIANGVECMREMREQEYEYDPDETEMTSMLVLSIWECLHSIGGSFPATDWPVEVAKQLLELAQKQSDDRKTDLECELAAIKENESCQERK